MHPLVILKNKEAKITEEWYYSNVKYWVLHSSTVVRIHIEYSGAYFNLQRLDTYQLIATSWVHESCLKKDPQFKNLSKIR